LRERNFRAPLIRGTMEKMFARGGKINWKTAITKKRDAYEGEKKDGLGWQETVQVFFKTGINIPGGRKGPLIQGGKRGLLRGGKFFVEGGKSRGGKRTLSSVVGSTSENDKEGGECQ